MHKIISDYLSAVCEPIRSRSLRSAVRAELATHILERCMDLEKEGLCSEEAARSAVERMGNPAELGRRVVGANRFKRDNIAVIGGIVLAVFGLLSTIMLSGSNLAPFIDIVSVAACLVLASAFALISAGRGLTLPKFLHQFKFGSVFSGVVVTLISLIIMLHNLTTPEALGPSVSVSLLSIFYGLLFAAIAHAAEQWCKPPVAGEIIALIED